MVKHKLKVSLVSLNPNGVHGTGLYLLQAFALENEDVKNNVSFALHFYDSLIPAQSNGIDYIIRRIMDDNSDIIGFSCYCWNIEEIIEIISTIKLIDPDKIILLGGPEASGNADYLMKTMDVVDFIIKGEGETAFQRLLLFYLGKITDICEIYNLVYRWEGNILHNNQAILDDLNDIPPIFSSGLADVNKLGNSLYSFETKRGCQYKCDYCFHHKGSHCIREYSLEHVKNELKALLESDIKYIWIIDPCFNENEIRSIEIIRFIVENNHKGISFGFELRNETLSEEFIIELSRITSTRFIAIGLQTLSYSSLEAVNRNFDKEKFESNIKLIKKYFHNSVRVHVDLIFGLPQDTLESYKKSIDYVLGLGGMIFTQPLKILKGTRIENNIEKHGIFSNPAPPYEVLFHNTFSYKDICQAKKINVSLYLYQCDKSIEDWFNEIHRMYNKSFSYIFEEVGNYLWDKGFEQIFLNYYTFSLEYITATLKGCIIDLYGIELPLTENYKLDQTVQIDWGSIANTQYYK